MRAPSSSNCATGCSPARKSCMGLRKASPGCGDGCAGRGLCDGGAAERSGRHRPRGADPRCATPGMFWVMGHAGPGAGQTLDGRHRRLCFPVVGPGACGLRSARADDFRSRFGPYWRHAGQTGIHPGVFALACQRTNCAANWLIAAPSYRPVPKSFPLTGAFMRSAM